MNRNAVGIDVFKGKSMVAILRPYGEIVSSPFELKHTSGNIQSLIEQIKWGTDITDIRCAGRI
ncbi:MAG: hypothetical protein WCD89_14260 [Anaerocolumna sp.]